MRVVLDTNILISAIFWNGKPRKVLDAAKNKRILLGTSRSMLNEFITVVLREEKFKTDMNDAVKRAQYIVNFSSLVEPKIKIYFSRDPGDDKVLECAASFNADCIVSADRDLLDIGSFLGIKIVTAEEFLKILVLPCESAP